MYICSKKYFLIVLLLFIYSCNDTLLQPEIDFKYEPLIVFTNCDFYHEWDDYPQGYEIFLLSQSRETFRISDSNTYHNERPKISPSGTEVLYSASGTLIRTDLYGTTKDSIASNVSSYFWHPDGKKVIFSEYDFNEHPVYYRIRIFDKDTRRSELIYSSWNYIVLFAISPDGQNLLFSCNFKLLLLSISGTNTKILDGPGTQKDLGCFSRDGKFILYSGTDSGSYSGIYRYDILNNSYKQLTYCGDSQPVYSPDGKNICFTSGRGLDGENSKLYIMESDGSNQKLLYDKMVRNIIWSRNSEYIYFLGTNKIFRIKPDGTGIEQIFDAGIDFIPDFDLF